MSLLILPNQLFEKKYIPKNIKTIILYEHPDFFKKYNFNKLKLVFHRATMKNYEELMKKYYNVIYVNFNDEFKEKYDFMFFQPNKMKIKCNIIPSPNFLCYDLFNEYRAKTDKFVFYNFYIWMKNKLNILPGIKSLDKYNRNKIPLNDIKNIPNDKYFKNKHIDNAIKYVNKYFYDNPGDLNNEFLITFTHAQTRELLKHFIDNKLENFGRYQDALVFLENKHTLYHSCLSAALNIGLINPINIINAVIKKNLALNSAEGLIRQLFWREYQLYCYLYMDIKPVFKNQYKLTKKWITGDVGILPIDLTIKKAFKTGYLHHIERLMVMGNFMLLYGLHHDAAYKWFMIFSYDAYEWVMYQNVYDMVYSMGVSMSRIYISSSNYILKMSNLKKDTWCEEWDKLYYKFLKKNKHIGYPYL